MELHDHVFPITPGQPITPGPTSALIPVEDFDLPVSVKGSDRGRSLSKTSVGSQSNKEARWSQSSADLINRAQKELQRDGLLSNQSTMTSSPIPPDDPNRVVLNVGGRYFFSTKEALTSKEPSSLFSALLSGRWPATQGEDGSYVFEHLNPDCFEIILQYMEGGEIAYLPTDVLREVLHSAEYLQLTHLLPCSLAMNDIDHLEAEDVLFMLKHQEPPRDLSRICLTFCNFAEMNLATTNFKEAVIVGTEFTNCDLSSSNIQKAQILFCSLEGADLRGCECEGGFRIVSSRLQRTNLSGLNLHGCRLKNVDLTGSILCGCQLVEVNLEGFQLEQVNFSGANLTRANLKNAKLQGAMFNDANLTAATLEGADAPNVDFAGAELVATKFDRANLEGSNFMSWVPTFVSSGDGTLRISVTHKPDVKFSDCSFIEANLSNTLLGMSIAAARTYWRRLAWRYVSRTKPRFDLTAPTRLKPSLLDVKQPYQGYLDGRKYTMDFDEEDSSNCPKYEEIVLRGLSNLNFEGAIFANAVLENAQLMSCKFNRADLRRASLSGANFSECEMRGAQLQAQSLPGVILEGAELDEANLTNADLMTTKLGRASVNSTVFIRARITPQLAELLKRTKAIMTKPANSQFLDGKPCVFSRPQTASSAKTAHSTASPAWS